MRYVLEKLWINIFHPLDDSELTVECLKESEDKVVLRHTAYGFEQGVDGLTQLELNQKL